MKTFFSQVLRKALLATFATAVFGCIWPGVSVKEQENVADTVLSRTLRMHWMGGPESMVKKAVEDALFGPPPYQYRPVSIAQLQALGFQCPQAGTQMSDKKCFFDWFVVRTLHGLPAGSEAAPTARIDFNITIDANSMPPKIALVSKETPVK